MQKIRIKNYSLREKIDKKEYNDYQYDFTYLTHLLEIGFPMIDSVFPRNERVKQKNNILKSLSDESLTNKDFISQTNLDLNQILKRFIESHIIYGK